MPLIPTEPVGSIPRPPRLIRLIRNHAGSGHPGDAYAQAEDDAVRDTLERFRATGSPVVTDGEQRKLNFIVYPIAYSPLIAPDGFEVVFAGGHRRAIPRLLAGPFRYERYAVEFLRKAQAHTALPIKQPVISASMLSLLYPPTPIAGYPRERFLADLLDEAERDIRLCLQAGAHCVQIDFTEARLAVKLDPTLQLLGEFIEINNWVLERFTSAERERIAIHSCPGADRDCSHSHDVGYEFVLPALFQLKARRFCLQLASERDPRRVLSFIAASSQPDQRIFVGVIDPNNPLVESPDLVCERILQAAKFIPLPRLGTTDDCGFAPFADDESTARDKAFAKIAARMEGNRLASEILFR